MVVGVLVLLMAMVVCAGAAVKKPARKVEVTGNTVFGTSEVLRLAAHGGWVPGGSGTGLSALAEAYFREGYLTASFETGLAARTSEDSVVTLAVEEGNATMFGHVRVKGVRVHTADYVRETLGIRESARFVPRILEDLMEDLLEIYDEQGYPFVQVWIDSLEFDPSRNAVDMLLYVVEGRERTVENITVNGLKKTRPELAIKMSGLGTGAVYRGGLLREAFVRMKGSGVFERVIYPQLRVSSSGVGVDVLLEVEETRRTHSFTGVIGYAAAESENKDQLSGLVELRLNNIGGTLKDVQIFWSNDGRSRSETRLRYFDRFFFGRLFTAGISLAQIGQDTLYTWQSVGIEAGKPAGQLGGSLVTFSAGVHADRNVFGEGTLSRSWRYRLAGGVSLTRAHVRGHTFVDASVRYTLARKKNYFRETGGTENANQYILEFEGNGSVGVRRSVGLYGGLVYRGLESNEDALPLSEQFYIGGAKTLRGYRENGFHGRRVATARTELRVGQTREENLFLFADGGYVLQETKNGEQTILEDIFKAGYGFGLRTRSRVGVI